MPNDLDFFKSESGSQPITRGPWEGHLRNEEGVGSETGGRCDELGETEGSQTQLPVPPLPKRKSRGEGSLLVHGYEVPAPLLPLKSHLPPPTY